MYKLISSTTILRTTDYAFIPVDTQNADYAAYLVWIAAGNTPDPIPTPALSDVQTSQIMVLFTAYSNAIAQPVSYTSVGAVTKLFQADSDSVSNLQKMLAAYSSTQTVPTGFYWVSEDNTQVPFTYADMQKLASTIGDQGWTSFKQLQTRKASVLAATTISAVQSISW